MKLKTTTKKVYFLLFSTTRRVALIRLYEIYSFVESSLKNGVEKTSNLFLCKRMFLVKSVLRIFAPCVFKFFFSYSLLPLFFSVDSVAAPIKKESPEFLGGKGAWKAFSSGKKKEKSCFMVSQAKKSKGEYSLRGTPHIMITRYVGKTTDTVSVVAGYTYKPKSQVTLSVDKHSFQLFVEGGTAWAYDEKADREIVAQLKKGQQLFVKGRSSRDTATTDEFSLDGVSAVHKLIVQKCQK